jgi:nucleotide-binding universal stress UspA family protein
MGVATVVKDVLEGPATDAILRAAEARKPDLIVIGARGLGTWQGLLLGSVSMAVTQRAECPVLVVK